MQINKFTVEYKETRSARYQSVTVGMTAECQLEEGDDYDAEFSKVRADLYKRVTATAKKALKELLDAAEGEA
jgi:hypothetical protein